MKAKFLCIALFAAGACISGRDTSKQTQLDSLTVVDSTVVVEKPVKVVNRLDEQARYIAGLDQLDSNSFTLLQEDPAWKSFKSSMDSDWNMMYEDRIGKMVKWQAENFSARINDSLPVFYPFSGPDFLHVYYLYPTSPEFIMAGLEPVRLPPSIDTLTVDLRARFLDSLNSSLNDIVKRSFFRTKIMAKDLTTEMGVLPLFYFFIERSGHELMEQEFIFLDTTSYVISTAGHKISEHKNPGVRLTFRNRTTQQETHLMYFSIDLSNAGLAERPEFEKFVKGYLPFNTFLKSASYLMHRPTFTKIRKLILNSSETIFQDDSGISYASLMKTKDYTVQLFGEYSYPARIFRDDRYQADLDSVYKKARNVQQLPFSLGYHWDTKKQNYMLFTRKVTKDRSN